VQVSTLREQLSNIAMQHAETYFTSRDKWKNISIYRALTERSDINAVRFIRCGAQDNGLSENRNVFQVAFLGCGAVATRTRHFSVECDGHA
jgi:aromatic ring-cleaving dioxygenase